MWKSYLPLLLVVSGSLHAQNWSAGVGTGPFVFGNFVERTLRIGSEEGSTSQTLRLSAATRAGLAADIERRLSSRFAVRLEGTFSKAPLAVKGSSNNGVGLDAGDLDVATFILPLVFNINRNGAFRFHILGGPAYAGYRIRRRTNAPSSISVFEGTRENWGAAFGGGVIWQWSERFGIEGGVTDISTSSPFRQSEFPAAFRVKIPRPHNVHTTVGIRFRF